MWTHGCTTEQLENLQCDSGVLNLNSNNNETGYHHRRAGSQPSRLTAQQASASRKSISSYNIKKELSNAFTSLSQPDVIRHWQTTGTVSLRMFQHKTLESVLTTNTTLTSHNSPAPDNICCRNNMQAAPSGLLFLDTDTVFLSRLWLYYVCCEWG